jgi:AraC-like DNA-binding protein
VTEIALDAGFGQPEHFATMFKRITGFTPSGFRRRCAV